MKRAAWLAVLLAVIVGTIRLFRPPAPTPSTSLPSASVTHLITNNPAPAERLATGVVVTTIAAPGRLPATQPGPLPGELTLRGYAEARFPPENDLTLMAHLMENSRLLLKAAADRPLSANGDWADLLCGRNAARERFLPDRHIALNAEGLLVDRWGTPLWFHALGGGRYDLRSAGPDRTLWTDDDIHRRSDGSIRHGAELPGSESAGPQMQRGR